MYTAVAALFAQKIDALFASEQSLEQKFKSMYAGLPFDRTEHWSGIIWGVLRDAWNEAGPVVKSEPTGMDKLKILKAAQDLLDYNLFTQVLLNLQGYTGMHYMTGDAKNEIARLKTAWDSSKFTKGYTLDPFAPKARMVKVAATKEQQDFNATISTIRALRIIEQFTPQISFRVSPKGSTPAFADSRNISMIGMGGDKYLKTMPTLQTYYLVWDQVPMTAIFSGIAVPPGGQVPCSTFDAPGIPYKFYSKSGGEVIQEVLFARKLMYEIFRDHDITSETCIMIPRMQSILIVADKKAENLHKSVERLRAWYPTIKLVEGVRA